MEAAREKVRLLTVAPRTMARLYMYVPSLNSSKSTLISGEVIPENPNSGLNTGKAFSPVASKAQKW